MDVLENYENEKENLVLKKMENLSLYFDEIGIGFYFWNNILELYLSYSSRTDKKQVILNLMRCMKIYDFNKRNKERYQREWISDSMRSDVMLSQSMEEFLDVLERSLPNLGVNTFSLYFFEKPLLHRKEEPWTMPKKIKRLFVLNKDTRQIEKNLNAFASCFDVVPSQSVCQQGNYYLHVIYFRDFCYGYFVVKIESGLPNRYENISGMITNFYNIFRLEQERKKDQLQILEERGKLQRKNLVMENEILMARKIQNQLIPVKSPRESIAFLYKPMEQVGGDFFDFLEFREKNSIGIFVSDVSGHGVPAAFITSMIKSAISQNRDNQDNPANMLLSLNKSLFNQTGGNFVTAFYGIYKVDSRKFLYANAGHNTPIIIQGSKFSQMETFNRSIPLGVLDNEEILENNLSYSNYTITLEAGTKLILYTDGLTEAQSAKPDKPDFETSLLEEVCITNSNKPPQAFINEIHRVLVNFHGSDNFDDDVCLICLDVI